MADAKATFAIVLEDETSSAAKSAATSLADLKEKIQEDTKALSEMRRAMRQMRQAGLSSSSAFKALGASVDSMKARIGQAQSAYANMGGEFGATGLSTKKAAEMAAKAARDAAKAFDLDLKDKAKAAGEAAQLLGSQIGAVGGPIASVTGKLGTLKTMLSNKVGIIIALGAAFLALGTAIISATVAMTRFAIVASNARREEALAIEGVTTAAGDAAASVNELQAAIDRASDSTNVGRGTLRGYARSLSDAGLRGDALTEAVEAMGIASMVSGDRGASRFLAMARHVRATGGDVRDLAADYRNRLGPIARRQMLEIGNQTDRARRSLDRIFSGVRIEGFLESLDSMLSLLSQSTATGRALKSIAETLLNPIVDSLGVVGPLLRRFFQGFVIGALIAVIMIQRVSNALEGLFGEGLLADVDMLRAALFLGMGAFVAITLAATVLTGIFLLWAAGIALVIAGFLILPALALAFAAAVGLAVMSIVDWFQETDFGELARSMIDGLIGGIRSGTSSLVRAVRGLAGSASDAFRSALGISSPSRVFAEFGINVAQGAAQGIEAGTPAVEDAAGALVDAPAGGGVGGSVSLSFGDININGAESSDPRELALQLRDELASLLEGVGIEMGVPA